MNPPRNLSLFSPFTTTCVALLLLHWGGLPAHGLVNLGQNGTIELQLTTSLTYDTNVGGRESSTEDVIASERITLNYNRPSRRFDISASLGIQATQYFDTTSLNSENIVFDLSLSPGLEAANSRFLLTADLILDTTTETDVEVGQIITTRTYGGSANLQYTPTRRYGASADVGYQRIDPDSGFGERDSYTFGASVFRIQSEMLQLNLGATYTETHTLNNRLNDSDTVSVFIGASGQLLAKVSGSVNVGATRSSSELTDASTRPYLSAAIIWQIDDSTGLSINASNGFSTGINGSQNSNFSLSSSLNRAFTQRMSGNIGVGYTRNKFNSPLAADRTDTEWSYNAGLSFEIARWGSLQLTTSYSDRDSDSALFSYDRFTVSLALNASW